MVTFWSVISEEKSRSLRIIYYKQKEKSLAVTHQVENVALLVLNSVFAECFPKSLLHFQKSIVRLITTQVSQSRIAAL